MVFVVAERIQVGSDCSREQHRILRNNSDLRSQLDQLHLTRRQVVDEHFAVCNGCHAQQCIDDARLASTSAATYTYLFSFFYRQSHVVQHWFVFGFVLQLQLFDHNAVAELTDLQP